MIECCATCKRKTRLEKFDYSNGGCKHSDMDGYACMLFVNEGMMAWMVGLDPEREVCEGYVPKEGTKDD